MTSPEVRTILPDLSTKSSLFGPYSKLSLLTFQGGKDFWCKGALWVYGLLPCGDSAGYGLRICRPDTVPWRWRITQDSQCLYVVSRILEQAAYCVDGNPSAENTHNTKILLHPRQTNLSVSLVESTVTFSALRQSFISIRTLSPPRLSPFLLILPITIMAALMPIIPPLAFSACHSRRTVVVSIITLIVGGRRG